MQTQVGQTTTIPNGTAWGGLCPPPHNYCPCCGRPYYQYYWPPVYQQPGINIGLNSLQAQ